MVGICNRYSLWARKEMSFPKWCSLWHFKSKRHDAFFLQGKIFFWCFTETRINTSADLLDFKIKVQRSGKILNWKVVLIERMGCGISFFSPHKIVISFIISSQDYQSKTLFQLNFFSCKRTKASNVSFCIQNLSPFTVSPFFKNAKIIVQKPALSLTKWKDGIVHR